MASGEHLYADAHRTVASVIRERRSVREFLPRLVSRELVAELIDTAVWAPNHYVNEPWRFYVVDGRSRGRLGEIARQVTERRLGSVAGADPVVVQARADEAAHSWAAVPLHVYATVVADADPVVDLENYGAASCAVQNLMLAAHAAGLASAWGSGPIAADPQMRALFGVREDERLVAHLRMGYPDPTRAAPRQRRTSGGEKTAWVDTAPWLA
ncbi:MAG: nitroreductase family protein [Chloroflexota bacterium]